MYDTYETFIANSYKEIWKQTWEEILTQNGRQGSGEQNT